MEQKDIKLCEELKEKADEVADRIKQLSDELETVESERNDFCAALVDCRSSAEAMTAENWEDKASEIIELLKGVL